MFCCYHIPDFFGVNEVVCICQGVTGSDLPSWISACGTVMAVVVALFAKPFFDWWNRPKICLLVENKRPFCLFVRQRFSSVPATQNKSMLSASANNSPLIASVGCDNEQEPDVVAHERDSDKFCDALFVRLRVVNNGVKRPANDVEVYLHKIKKMGSGEPPIEIGMNLKWSNVGGMFFSHIPAKGGEKYCDIGFITDPTRRSYDLRYCEDGAGKGKYNAHQPALCFMVTHPLSEGQHIVGPGVYEIFITVLALGAAPVKAKMLIEFSEWSTRERDVLTKCSITTLPNCQSLKEKFICLLEEIFPE